MGRPASALVALIVVLCASIGYATANVVTLPKCCPQGEELVRGNCVPNPDNLSLVRAVVHSADLELLEEPQHEFVHRPLDCPRRPVFHPSEFWILEDGSLHRGTNYPRLTSNFCLDHIRALNATHPVLCPRSMDGENTGILIASVGYLVSIPFSLATIVVYVFIKDLRTFHNNITVLTISALVVSSVLLVLTGFRIVEPQFLTCTFTGNQIKFFY